LSARYGKKWVEKIPMPMYDYWRCQIDFTMAKSMIDNISIFDRMEPRRLTK
jgi:hypothetical protein